jgi:hypothetical protein
LLLWLLLVVASVCCTPASFGVETQALEVPCKHLAGLCTEQQWLGVDCSFGCCRWGMPPSLFWLLLGMLLEFIVLQLMLCHTSQVWWPLPFSFALQFSKQALNNGKSATVGTGAVKHLRHKEGNINENQRAADLT